MAIIKILDENKTFDTVFAVNALTAIDAMQTIQKRGIEIPKETAIVGFYDGYLSRITKPSLTSVDQHTYEMGTIATETLLKRILSGIKDTLNK